METTMTGGRLAGVSRCTARAARRAQPQAGFSLLEVMIAGAIITIGLLALLGLFGTALAATQSAQMDEIGHARAMQILESVYTARQTSQLGFNAIDNKGTGAGIFTAGLVALSDPGPDGLDGTADDITPPAPIVLPGPDGKLGTPDDQTVPLTAFQRQITITTINPNLKQVVVTVQYPVASGRLNTYTVQALISAYH
jgi:prepilin-type N-terminal cleavage/methylation domain-containing protein